MTCPGRKLLPNWVAQVRNIERRYLGFELALWKTAWFTRLYYHIVCRAWLRQHSDLPGAGRLHFAGATGQATSRVSPAITVMCRIIANSNKILNLLILRLVAVPEVVWWHRALPSLRPIWLSDCPSATINFKCWTCEQERVLGHFGRRWGPVSGSRLWATLAEDGFILRKTGHYVYYL